MLAQTMLRWMQDHRGCIRATDVYEYRDGCVALDFWTRMDQTQSASVAMGVIECGFRMLAERYPEHARVGNRLLPPAE